MSELSDYQRLIEKPAIARYEARLGIARNRIKELETAEPRKLAIGDAIKAIEAIDQFNNCESLGLMDPETGARECSLERRGTCLCQERTEAIEKAVDKLKAMIR